jgi:hypothetical protein
MGLRRRNVGFLDRARKAYRHGAALREVEEREGERESHTGTSYAKQADVGDHMATHRAEGTKEQYYLDNPISAKYLGEFAKETGRAALDDAKKARRQSKFGTLGYNITPRARYEALKKYRAEQDD